MSIWKLCEGKNLDIHEIRNLFHENRVENVYDFWVKWAQIGGFFSKKDLSRILERHVFESLVFLATCIKYLDRKITVSRETKFADIGTGPGVPGLLVPAWKGIDLRVDLIDSSARRLGIVEKNFLYQKNINCIYARAEEIETRYDVLLSRAYLKFPVAVETITNLVAIGGYYFFFAGESDLALDDKKTIAHLLRCGFVSCETLPLNELGFLGKRNVIVLFKDRKAEKGYPRPWKRIKEMGEKWEK